MIEYGTQNNFNSHEDNTYLNNLIYPNDYNIQTNQNDIKNYINNANNINYNLTNNNYTDFNSYNNNPSNNIINNTNQSQAINLNPVNNQYNNTQQIDNNVFTQNGQNQNLNQNPNQNYLNNYNYNNSNNQNIYNQTNLLENGNINQTNNINAITPLTPYNNNMDNSHSNITSNDFWQKIDSRRANNSQNGNNPQVQQPQNNNNSNNNGDQMNQVLDDFFGNFFNDEHPIQHTTSNQITIRMGNTPQPHIEPHVFFHSFFTPFGIMSDIFQRNYSSNFGREIARLIELSRRGQGRTAHPPATNEALRKLKRFPLAERFCKRNNGQLELPNCCICQDEIQLGKETVLLPCGHMYHWECCLEWLKTNNTCPICRFEIK